MRRRLGLSIAWISATILSVVIAGAAVSSVRSQVTEEPTALGSPAAAALAVDAAPTTTQPEAASSVVPTTTTVVPSPTVNPSIPQTIGSTAVPVPPSSTSTSTTQPTASTKTYTTDGGTVRIAISGQSVTFSGAVPNPGWKVEVEDTGPEKVKVKFEQNGDDDDDHEIEFKAQFEDGELEISIDDH